MSLFKPILVGVAPTLDESQIIRSHQHYWTALTNPPDTATRWPDWTEVTNKPTTLTQSDVAETITAGWTFEAAQEIHSTAIRVLTLKDTGVNNQTLISFENSTGAEEGFFGHNGSKMELRTGDGDFWVTSATNTFMFTVTSAGLATVYGNLEVESTVDFSSQGAMAGRNITDFSTGLVGNTRDTVFPWVTGFQAVDRPPSANYHSGLTFRHNLSSDYATTLATGSTSGGPIMWLRNTENGVLGDWYKVWTELNFGLNDIAFLAENEVVTGVWDFVNAGATQFGDGNIFFRIGSQSPAATEGLSIWPGPTLGGWARGVVVYDQTTSTRQAGFGWLGSNESVTSFNIGFGASWWATDKTFTVSPGGSCAITDGTNITQTAYNGIFFDRTASYVRNTNTNLFIESESEINFRDYAAGTPVEYARIDYDSKLFNLYRGMDLVIYDDANTNAVRIDHTGSNVRFDNTAGTTNNVLITGGMGLRLYDSGDTDYVTYSHDGTDFNTEMVNTATWNITGPDNIRFENDTDLVFETSTGTDDGTRIYRAAGNAMRIGYAANAFIFDAVDNSVWEVRNSDDQTIFRINPDISTGGDPSMVLFDNTGANSWYINNTGANAQWASTSVNFQIQPASGGSTQFLAGRAVRIQDSTNSDWAAFSHDGTDFNTAFTNTNNWNIDDAVVTISSTTGETIGGTVAIKQIEFTENASFIHFNSNTGPAGFAWGTDLTGVTATGGLLVWRSSPDELVVENHSGTDLWKVNFDDGTVTSNFDLVSDGAFFAIGSNTYIQPNSTSNANGFAFFDSGTLMVMRPRTSAGTSWDSAADFLYDRSDATWKFDTDLYVGGAITSASGTSDFANTPTIASQSMDTRYVRKDTSQTLDQTYTFDSNNMTIRSAVVHNRSGSHVEYRYDGDAARQVLTFYDDINSLDRIRWLFQTNGDFELQSRTVGGGAWQVAMDVKYANATPVDFPLGLTSGGSAVLTGNQTITLSGDLSGSGTTSISATVDANFLRHVSSGYNSADITVSATAPSSPAQGDIWIDTS